MTALSAPSMQRQDNNEGDDGVDDYEYDDPNDPYLQKITVKLIRTSDGSEVVIQVQRLEDETTELELSTRLVPWHRSFPLQNGPELASGMQPLLWCTFCLCSSQANAQQATLLVLECGLGVPGMLRHSLYGCETYLDDQESMVSQLIHNVKHNFGSNKTNRVSMASTAFVFDAAEPGASGASTIHSLPLTWSHNNSLLHKIDFFNCHQLRLRLRATRYGESRKLLSEVLETVLKRNPGALLLTSVERRNMHGVDGFVRCMTASPFVLDVTKVWNDEDFKIQIYQNHGDNEYNKSNCLFSSVPSALHATRLTIYAAKVWELATTYVDHPGAVARLADLIYKSTWLQPEMINGIMKFDLLNEDLINGFSVLILEAFDRSRNHAIVPGPNRVDDRGTRRRQANPAESIVSSNLLNFSAVQVENIQ
jgi:hypothetical protein